MTRFRLFHTALVFSALTAAPVSAQQVIDEPGAYSFYHPNSDVLNGGAPTPALGRQSPRDALASTVLSTTRSHRVSRTSIKRY
jgi:hypothetical protein